MEDAVFTGEDAAEIDAATDAAVADAPPDSEPDAAACAANETRCGTTCVDLATDEQNCGACGYEVRGVRECLGGKPTPGWKMMATEDAPTQRAKIMGWTGRRFLVLTDGEEEFYDPDLNAWTPNAFSRPAFSTNVSGEWTWARIPGRDEVVMWSAGHATNGTTVYKFTDDGATGYWRTLPTADGPPGPRKGPTIAASATDVYVGWGQGFESVYRYHLADDTWHSSGQHPLDCGASVARWMSPLALVGNELVTHGGYRADGAYCLAPQLTRTGLPDMTTWSSGPALTPRSAQLFMEFEGRLLYGGGTRTSGPLDSSCAMDDLMLVDVATGAVDTNVNRFTQPPRIPANLFAVRSGRGIMIWGGRDPKCSNLTLTAYGTGSIGVPITTAGALNIEWRVLPSSAPLVGRHSIPNDHTGWGSTQPMWSGYEAIVYGGFDGSDAWRFDGATYQPPAGCVCPSADTEACAGVTDVQPDCMP